MEEHTVLAKKLLTRLIYGIISIQLLLALVDGFPFLLSCLSIGSHVVYAGNLRRFPIVKLSDPVFILSCGLPLPIPLSSCPTRPPAEAPKKQRSADLMPLLNCSPRPPKPLLLVPPLLAPRPLRPLLPLPPHLADLTNNTLRSFPPGPSHVHRSSLLLRHLRLAHPVLLVRQLERR